MNPSPFLSRWPEHRAVPGGGPPPPSVRGEGQGVLGGRSCMDRLDSAPREAPKPPPLSGEGVHIDKSALIEEGRGPFKLEAYQMRD